MNTTYLSKHSCIWRLPIIPSYYISDYEAVPRTKKERFFSWPWTPWVKTKLVPSTEIYIVPSEMCIITTFRLKEKIETAILDSNVTASKYNL